MSSGMNKMKWMLLVLCFLASNVHTYQLIIYEATDESSQIFYNNLLYLIVYAFLWNCLIEISMLIILHFKQAPTYIANHSFINLCIIIGQITNNLLLAQKNGFNNKFFILEAILTCLEIVQILLGNALNKRLESEELVKRIFILRFFHRNNGRILYLLRKYQLFSYAYIYLKGIDASLPLFALAPVIIVTIVTHVLAYIIFRKRVFANQSIKFDYLIQSSNEKKVAYLELIKNIERGEFDENTSGVSLVDEENSLSLHFIKSSIKWVIIEDKVYDISDLRHPKGNYILKGIAGKDITREMHGFKSYRFESKSKRFSKILKHKHVPRTFEHLAKTCIGPLTICPLITHVEGGKEINKEDSAMTIQVSDMLKNSGLCEIRNKEIDWQSDSLYSLNEKGAILYAHKISKDHLVNLSVYWLYTFGKYFVITFDNGSKDFMYPLLSFTPIYIHKKFEWYQKLGTELTNEIKLPSSALHKDLKDLYTVMLQGLDRNQKQALESTNEIRSHHLPLYWQRKKNSDKLKTSSFNLLGPVGLGLGFDANCSSKVLIIAKDEGILPLIDFFEFLSQKALIELTGINHPVFTNEYLYTYSNNPEFSLFWEVSESYWSTAEALALSILHTLNITYRRDSTKRVKKLVKLITISSILSTSQNNIVLTVENEKRDFSDILRLNGNDFEKYIVSGNDKFVNHILKTSNLPQNAITVL